MSSWLFSALVFQFSKSFVSRQNCTFGKVAETCWCRDGGKVVLPHPDQVLALALRVETLLLHVPGCQESTGVEALSWELDYLLWLDPAAVHKLEALQVDDLRFTAWQLSWLVYKHNPPTSEEAFWHLPGWVAASRGPASWWPAGASCTWSSSRARPPQALPRWWMLSDSCPGWWAQPGPGETAPHCSAPLQSLRRPA